MSRNLQQRGTFRTPVRSTSPPSASWPPRAAAGAVLPATAACESFSYAVTVAGWSSALPLSARDDADRLRRADRKASLICTQHRRVS
jgi:hypothetical protein